PALKANLKGGKSRIIVNHCQTIGDAELKWNVEIEQTDDYDLVLNYSVLENGASVIISSANQTVSHNLEITRGRAIKFPNWKLNMERKLIGQISLTKGFNALNLSLNVSNEQSETNIYSLELVPSSKKKLIANDLKRIESIRPDMKWFSKLRYGAMFHWTSEAMPLSGEPKPYKEAVKDFDVDAFVAMVEEMGLDYIIFTGNHAQPHFPGPLKEWEKEFPGMTTERDLITEISEALKKKNIKFILYLSTHVYSKFREVESDEFERLNFELLAEIGEYYKDKIDAYWFDGWYQCHREYPAFNYEKFYNICKLGNPNRLLSLNTWLYPINTPWQDYWAGEVYTEGVPQRKSICQTGPAKGLQFHHLVVLQTKEGWVHTKRNTKIAPPSFTAEELVKYISSCDDIGPISINMSIYQDGTVGEEALQVMREVKAIIRK
ncbi:alpha-L-fucosidase, partial [Draconibacterium sp.]|nr:alpha-L-fucosidase [Draconibacterium sp.]